MLAGGKALCCTACQDGQSMASGSSNGSVHVWRVEYVTRSGNMPDKYTGLQCKPLCQVAPLFKLSVLSISPVEF